VVDEEVLESLRERCDGFGVGVDVPDEFEPDSVWGSDRQGSCGDSRRCLLGERAGAEGPSVSGRNVGDDVGECSQGWCTAWCGNASVCELFQDQVVDLWVVGLVGEAQGQFGEISWVNPFGVGEGMVTGDQSERVGLVPQRLTAHDPCVAMRVLHPRRPHGDELLLRGQLQDLGPHACPQGRRRGHGRVPQLGAPFRGARDRRIPAALNDCISGLKWVHANAATLNIDPARIIVAGESSGGNPLRDKGIAFDRLLMDSGVPARCRQMMGACHGVELLLPAICPDIARSTAADIADFAITSGGPQ
jgi:hypothetical protein